MTVSSVDGGINRVRELTSVQIIRAVAAVGVVISHAYAAAALPKYFAIELLGGWPAFGRSGVELFFVLSGFLMYTIHKKDFSHPERVLYYAKRRLIRIYPAYWIYISITISILMILGQYAELSAFDIITIYTLFRFSDVALPLGVAWTLFHEMIFYVLFSVLIWRAPLGLGVLMLWLSIALWLRITPGSTMFSVALSEINILFGFGILLGLVFSRYVIPYGKILCGLGAIGYCATFKFLEQGSAIQSDILFRTIAYGIFGCISIYGLLCIEAKGNLRRVPFLMLLGDASYSIYLLHFPLISLLFKLGVRFGILQTLPAEMFTVLVAIAAIGISVCVYQLVERPIQALMKRAFFQRAKLAR